MNYRLIYSISVLLCLVCLYWQPIVMADDHEGLGIAPISAELTNPVRMHKMPHRIMKCNSLQIRAAQAPLWKGSLDGLGVSSSTTELLLRRLERLKNVYCRTQITRNTHIWKKENIRFKNVFGTVITEVGNFFELDKVAAEQLLAARLLAKFREIEASCYEPGGYGSLLLDRLPATPKTGWSTHINLEPTDSRTVSMSDLVGNCGSGSSRSAAISRSDTDAGGSGINMNAVGACLDSFATAYDCDHPASEEINQNFYRGARDLCDPGCNYTEARAENGYRETFSNSDSATSVEASITRNSEGRALSWSIDISWTNPTTGASGVYIYEGTSQNHAVEAIAPMTEESRATADNIQASVDSTPEFVLARNMAEVFGGIFGAVLKAIPKQCVPISPAGSSPVIGYLRPQSIVRFGDTTGPGVGPIGVPDAFAYCLCQGGGGSKELAHMMGFSCPADNEWMVRMNCLNNPYGGPTGGIRPECLKYLEEDVGIEVVQANVQKICESTIRCEDGAAVGYKNLSTGQFNCNCRVREGAGAGAGGGGIPPQCMTIDCSEMAEAGSDCCATRVPKPIGRAAIFSPSVLDRYIARDIFQSFENPMPPHWQPILPEPP